MPRLFCGSFCSRSSATRGILLASILAVWPTTAHADWFLTPFAGLKFGGDSQLIDLEGAAGDTKFTLGGIVGVISDGILGVEGEVGYIPRHFERSGIFVARSHVLTIMGNLVLTTPRDITGDSLRPFISGGGGWMRARIHDQSVTLPVNSNLFGINVGGGATGRVTDLTSVRFELRYFRSVTSEDEDAFPGTALSLWRAAVGLTFRY